MQHIGQNNKIIPILQYNKECGGVGCLFWGVSKAYIVTGNKISSLSGRSVNTLHLIVMLCEDIHAATPQYSSINQTM